MVLFWKKWCALCGSIPASSQEQFTDLRQFPDLYSIARAFNVKDKRKCPSCSNCRELLKTVFDFSVKCAKTQAMLISCAKRKLYAEEDVLQFRKEFEQGKHKAVLRARVFKIKGPTAAIGKKDDGSDNDNSSEDSSDSEDEDEQELDEEPVTEGSAVLIESFPENTVAEEVEPIEEDQPEVKEEIEIEMEPCDEKEEEEDSDKELIPHTQYSVTNSGKQRIYKHAYKCSHCDLILHSKYHLKLHEKKHGPKPAVKFPFVCDGCGKKFKHVSHLRAHAVVHSDEKPYPCEVCGVPFKLLSGLKVHMESHLGKKYICPICGEQLSTNHTYHMHLRIHSTARPYKCHVCPKTFKRHTPLKEHLFGHTDLRPYSCPFCEKTFVNGSSCRLHKVRLHPKELAELEASGRNEEVLQMHRKLPTLKEIQARISAMYGLNPVEEKEPGEGSSTS